MLCSTLAAAALSACSSDSTTNTFAPLGLSLSLAPTADTIFVSDTIGAGNTARLTVSAMSINNPISTPSGVEWSSSAPSVASVAEDGTITAHSVGTTTITARVNNAKANAALVVAYRATKLTLSATSLAGVAGDTITVTASAVDPKGALVPGTAYVFSSADPSVASVTITAPRTAQIVLKKAGAANVTVTAGGQTGTLTGTVSARDFISSAVTSAPSGSLVLSAGTDATCGLIALGRSYCFGRAALTGVAKDTACFGGTGTEPCTLVPLRTGGQLNLVSVTVGDAVACGAAADGRAYCWGSQAFGALGNGSSGGGTATAPALVVGAGSRTAFLLNRISAGGNHVCALNSAGAAFCWGKDSSFQLGNGDGNRVNSTTPIPVAGGNVYSTISAGHDHTCALTAAGVAFCWGSNELGQLGAGLFDDAADSPVAVATSTTFTQISSGLTHTCALTAAGVAFCWGDNSSGQLGDANASGFQSIVPVAVAGGLRFKSISAGAFTTCGITTGGAAFCWGDNAWWQLGNSSDFSNPAPTAVGGGRTDFAAVTVGARHACATATGGGAYCWGSNIFGALGNELQAMQQASPTRVVFP